ncbi:MAG TPA: hypothetical protein PLC65_15130 [Bacteroidia bacterium]|nr:hypothetical protein [Bacteroidia bacterium]
MKGFYAIRHKGRIAFLLLMLIVIEVFNNSSQSNNILQLENAFKEVYADRLIVQDYIYSMSEKIHVQKYGLMSEDSNSLELILRDEKAIEDLINQYELTKLTDNEKVVLTNFKKNVREFELLAVNYVKERDTLLDKQTCLRQADIVLADLEELNKIQLSRSNKINNESVKIVSFAGTISQLNWALIIVIGLIIQMIVFSSGSAYPKINQNEFMN